MEICQSEEGHDRVIIPGVDALRSFGELLLSQAGQRASEARDYDITLVLGKAQELPFHGGFLTVNWLKSENQSDICVNFKKEQQHNVEICDWDGDLLAPNGALPSLYVRNWRPGDVLQRDGHKSAEKIKTLFQSGKVLLWERKHWPVVLAGENIVWTRQFGASAGVGAAKSSRRSFG